jgi:3-oxoacyl-(acyl-carrier-protein) synthase
LGVVAPNASGVNAFEQALREGKSGIRFFEGHKDLNMKCQIGGQPILTREYLEQYLPEFYIEKLRNHGVIYGCLAGLEAWEDAGLPISSEKRDKKTSMVFGSGALGMDEMVGWMINTIDEGDNRKLGSRVIPQSMNSGAAAYLNQILGLGYVQSNSSACITGSESILMGYRQVMSGQVERALCGSTEGVGHYIWASFDAMRVLVSDSNEEPEAGSRPMSATSRGFVPGGGSGALVLETLESAQARGAKIYAEILGGAQNCGGLRNGGTMTAPNSEALVECIEDAVSDAGITPESIDLISGHLTSTRADPLEISNWSKALNLQGDEMPLINTPKSMIGHCIGGAGSIESVACILQLYKGFVHRNLNVNEDSIHPAIKSILPLEKIPTQTIEKNISTIIKANFGFGDMNCCLVFQKFEA